MDGERIIFVGGSPRSGTTLLQNILDSHPLICGGPEFNIIPDIIVLRKKFYNSIKSGSIDVFCSYDDVDRAICLFIENLILPLAIKNNCKMISEKTPWNVLVFNELLKICPKAKFIHIVRDPRAIVSSLLEVGKRAKKKGKDISSITKNTLGAINCIRDCLSSGFSAEKRFPNRVLSITYESLVQNPECTTKKICEFLEVGWSSEMIYPSNKKHFGEKEIDDIWINMKVYYSNPDISKINKWKDKLSNIQKAQVNEAFRSNTNLKQLGYFFNEEKDLKIYKIIRIITLKLSFGVRKLFYKLVKLVRKSHVIVKICRIILEGKE